MPDLVKHALRSNVPDPVDGSYTTRCGSKGWPLGIGLFDNGSTRFERAMSEGAITCPKCRLKITPGQRKFMRILLDYGPCEITIARGFDYSVDGGLRIWARQSMLNTLVRKGVVGRGMRGWTLTMSGRELAARYPKVEEDF